MRRRCAIVVLLGVGLLCGACGERAAQGEPTKEALVQTLRDLVTALEARDYDLALTHMVPLPGIPPAETPELLANLLERGEISAAGIDRLEREAVFGELDDLLRERGKSWAARAGVNENHCYALVADGVAAAWWDGETFKVIHLDDVGKEK